MENNYLAALRDALLPKIISGQLEEVLRCDGAKIQDSLSNSP